MNEQTLNNFLNLSAEQQDKIIFHLTKIVATYQQPSYQTPQADCKE